MLVQTVVDHTCLFRDLCIGWPGIVHDARVLANSSVFKKASSGTLLQGGELVQGQNLQPFLIGDSAYPLLPFLIKPFSFSLSLTSRQKKCNYRLSRARVVVEIAFGRLKARWRRLAKKIDMLIDNVPHIIAACCVLHNLCEIHGDTFNEEWLQALDLDKPDTVPMSPSIIDQSMQNVLIEHIIKCDVTSRVQEGKLPMAFNGHPCCA